MTVSESQHMPIRYHEVRYPWRKWLKVMFLGRPSPYLFLGERTFKRQILLTVAMLPILWKGIQAARELIPWLLQHPPHR